MREVAEGIYRLGSSVHNFYIVTEGGKATVVDAGCSREWPAAVSGLEGLGLGVRDVEAVVITHGHSDHVGGARAAQDDGVAVKVHDVEGPRVRGEYRGPQIKPSQLPLWKPTVWVFVVAMVRAGVMHHPFLPSVETFGDGEVLDLPGRPRALHTPGHTEGHAAFHLAERRVLFTGDGLVTRDLLSSRRGPTLLGERFHADPLAARRSLEKLRGVEADLLLPGHGDPWRGSVADAVDAAAAD